MFTRHRSALTLCLLLAASACKSDGATVQEVCELTLSCSCSTPVYATVDACVSDYDATVQRHKDLASANGLTFNQGCYDTFLGQLQAIGCGSDFSDDFFECGGAGACSLVHGDKPVGAACKTFGDNEDFSDCGNKLYCAAGTCIDYCARLSAGAACIDAEFEPIGVCADSLYCDYFDSMTCKARLGAGSPCTGFDSCKAGLVCGDDGICAALPGKGEACDFECSGALVCDETGVCASPPGEGEACTFSCAAGLECNFDDICVPSEPLLCGLDLSDE